MFQWVIGKRFPKEAKVIARVESVRVTDRELEVLLEEVQGIPRSNGTFQTWYGDDAKYIVMHFRMYHANNSKIKA